MKDGEKIKFAIAGLGHIGKRHAAMVSQNSECAWVAGCDVLSKEKVKVENNSIAYFNSVEELLKSDLDFDVLSIATPNGFHEEHALQGLKAGKHVLIEKPMALTKAGCERIIYEALHQHRQVFCIMQNRYSPTSHIRLNFPSSNLAFVEDQDSGRNLTFLRNDQTTKNIEHNQCRNEDCRRQSHPTLRLVRVWLI